NAMTGQSVGMAAEAAKLLPVNAPLAMLLGLQAYATAQTVQARSTLIEASQQPLNDVRAVAGGGGTVALSPDGDLLAVGDTRGTVHLWRVQDGRVTGDPVPLRMGGAICSVAFSGAGGRLAAGDSGGHVAFWRVGVKGKRVTAGTGTPLSTRAQPANVR